MIKELETKDNTLSIKAEPSIVITNDNTFTNPDNVNSDNVNAEDEEIKDKGLGQYATDYLQSVYDWRNNNGSEI